MTRLSGHIDGTLTTGRSKLSIRKAAEAKAQARHAPMTLQETQLAARSGGCPRRDPKAYD